MTTPPKSRSGAKRSQAKGRTAGKTTGTAKPAAQKKARADAAEKDPVKEQPQAAPKAAAAETSPKTADNTVAPDPVQIPDPTQAYVPPPTRTAGAARTLAWLTLGLGLAVAVAAVTWPWWSERVAEVFPALAPAGESAPAIGQLTGRVQALEQQTKSLATEKSGTLKQLEQERARFQAELKTLMARLGEVENAVAEARNLVKAADAPASKDLAKESLIALSDRLTELEKGGGPVGALSQRVEQIEKGSNQTPGSTSAPVAPDPEVMAALDDMAARLKRLEKETDGHTGAGSDAAARAIVLAVAQLRDAMRLGRPFADDLEALKALAEGRPAIAQAVSDLAPQAETGVASLAVLRTRFKTLAGPIVTAAGAAGGEGWIAEAAAKLSSLVTVRRIGEAAPDDSVDALVARVDVLLSAGDLRAATDAIKLLKGKPAEVVAPWLRAADARLVAEQAVANLHIHALSLLAPAKAGG